jgi:MFS family permease
MFAFLANKRLHPIIILGTAISASVPIIFLFIPLFITGELGLSYAQAGLAVSMYGAAHLLQFLFGHFADTFGRKRLLSLGGMIYGLALIGLAMQGTSYGQLLIFITLCGIGNSIWGVAATSYLAAIASEYGGREEMIGAYISITKIGEVVSFLVIGLLVVAADERTVFSVVGGIVIVASLLSSALFINLFKRAKAQLPVRL